MLEKYLSIINNGYGFSKLKSDFENLLSETEPNDQFLQALIKGELHALVSEYSEAKKEYEKCWTIDPTSNIAAAKMIQIENVLDNKNLVDTEYYDVVKDCVEFLCLKARVIVHLQENDMKSLKEDFRYIQKDKNVCIELKQYYKALELSYSDDYEGSRKIHEELRKNKIVHIPTENNYAVDLRLTGDTKQAIKVLENALEIDSKNIRMMANLGIYNHSIGKYKKSNEYLLKCIQIKPDELWIYSYIAMNFNSMNEPKEEERYLKLALDKERNAATLYSIGALYYNRNQYDESLMYLNEAIKLEPKDGDINYLLGLIFEELNDEKESLRYYAKAYLYSDYDPRLQSYIVDSISEFVSIESSLPNLLVDLLVDEYHKDKTKKSLKAYLNILEIVPSCVTTSFITRTLKDEPTLVKWYIKRAYELYQENNIYGYNEIYDSLCSEGLDLENAISLSKKFVNDKNYNMAYEILRSKESENKSLNSAIHYLEVISRLDKCKRGLLFINNLSISLKRNPKISDFYTNFSKMCSGRKREPKLDEILLETDGILLRSEENEKKYKKFLTKKKSYDSNIEFHNFRKWNSYTPLLSDGVGGGFFLRVRGKGIVIDPGFNFIDNMIKSERYVFDSIDAVIISHAHNDHAADLENILTLLYKHNDFIEKDNKKVSQGIHNRSNNSSIIGIDSTSKAYSIVESKGNEENKRTEDKGKKVIDLYLSKSTFFKYSGMLELVFDKAFYRVHILEENTKYKIDDNAHFTSFSNEHFDAISDYCSMGILFHLDNVPFLYTGDTKISENLVNKIKDLLSAGTRKQKDFVLLANLGGVKEYEIEYNLNGYKKIYGNHLGRIGVYKLVDEIKPTVCLLSEFGEELKESRIDVVQSFQKQFAKTIFVPCEIDLHMDLEKVEIRAIDEINGDKTYVYPKYSNIAPNDVIFERVEDTIYILSRKCKNKTEDFAVKMKHIHKVLKDPVRTDH